MTDAPAQIMQGRFKASAGRGKARRIDHGSGEEEGDHGVLEMIPSVLC